MRQSGKKRSSTKEGREALGNASRGRVKSEETIQKLREARLGTKLSEETKKKISIGQKKRLPESYPRKPCSEEQKNKIRMGQTLRHSIYQIDKQTKSVIKEWDSITQASNVLKIDRGGISMVCKAKQIYAGGFKWEYKNK
jgi:hypothetical protein